MAGVGAGLAVLGGSVTGILASMTTGAVDHVTEIRKAAAQVGASAEGFSALAYAAKRVDVDIDGVVVATRKLERAIADAMGGNMAAVEWFAKLGLNAKELEKLPLEEKFVAIADGMAKLPTEAEKQRAAFALLGRSGVALLPILEKGGDALRALFQTGRERGAIVTTEEVERAKKYKMAIASVTESLTYLKHSIGLAAMPDPDRMKRFTDAAAKWIQQAREWVEQNHHIVQTIAAIGVAATFLGTALVGVGIAAAGLASVGAALKIIFAPELLLVTAFASAAIGAGLLGYGLVDLATKGQASAGGIKLLTEYLQALDATFRQTWGGISDALKSGDLEGAFDVAIAGILVAWKKMLFQLQYDWLVGWQALKDMVSHVPRMELATKGIDLAMKIQEGNIRNALMAVKEAEANLKETVNNVETKSRIASNTAIFKSLMDDIARGNPSAGFSAPNLENVASMLSSVAGARQFGGFGAEQLGIGAGIRKSDETKELEKANRKLNDIDRHLEDVGMRWGE